ncbi:ABC transporter ATP-binding protein [Thermoplasmatales archaeon ex4484_6]|nr:MAG: ABC transporter ATP-binding protein [Thermoplasmatales archaeon ex4484_6]RLF69222.1 MAG: ABC transporter ATP-binding protein [Thermoplasmata archaeon]
MNAVEIRDLVKSYGKIRAVDGLDLSIPKGTVFGLLGPNGSGKTTTIKVLCRLLNPDSGSASVLGHDISDRGYLQKIGYMPQETALYDELTVHENLKLFAGIHGLRGREFEKRETEVLSDVRMIDRRDSLLSELSGGQRHRVSLAAALIHEPELLFLDEPTVGVDPPLRARFWEGFSNLKKKGITIVMSTHYMDEAVNCDLIGMMRDGKLIAQGTPSSILERTGERDLEDAFLHIVSGGGTG